MSVSVGKKCGIAVIIVVIVPIILGMAWPDGTETIDVYDVDRGIDITGDLSNRTIPYYDVYTGPLNNMTVYSPYSLYGELEFPNPVAQTDIPNAYPVASLESTAQENSVIIGDLGMTSKARYGLWDNSGFTITGDSTTYYYADYWPATNTLVLFNQQRYPVKTITPEYTDELTGNLTVATFGAPVAYVDIAKGLQSSQWWYWLNEMSNKSVDIWVKIDRYHIDSHLEVGNIDVYWNGNGISATDGTTTAVLGSVYEYASIKLNSDGTAKITGLIGVESFVDTSYTEGNSVDLEFTDGSIDRIEMRGAHSSWWVKSSMSVIGQMTGIYNSAFSPEAYYGTHSWQFQIINPSTFGDSLVFDKNGDTTTYPIESGTITVTNLVTNEQSKEAVRGMRVLSLIEDGNQNIYINGIRAIQYPATGDVTVTLAGSWIASVVTAKVVQSQQERYTWDLGSFGFDQTAFCIVGLLSCASVMIIGSMWGRKSGESVLALFVTMIICGIAFYCLI